jgi:transglutaminase-like putative cysteine protease
MHLFRLGSILQYQAYEACTFVFNITVMQNEHQKILSESIELHPELKIEELICAPDQSRYLRVNVPKAGSFEIEYRAEVELNPHYATVQDIHEVPHASLPLDLLTFLYPSRYCESDRLSRLAMLQFGHLLPGHERVQGICNWIYDNVVYLPGSTSSNTSAFNTVSERAGVCRDFAHLGIAFCRALSIPARFVSGYAVGLNPPDFHAAFEAYLGDRWYLFDATRLVSLDQFVRVGTGHDAADVSFATIFGPADMTRMTLFIDRQDQGGVDIGEMAISTIAF